MEGRSPVSVQTAWCIKGMVGSQRNPKGSHQISIFCWVGCPWEFSPLLFSFAFSVPEPVIHSKTLFPLWPSFQGLAFLRSYLFTHDQNIKPRTGTRGCILQDSLSCPSTLSEGWHMVSMMSLLLDQAFSPICNFNENQTPALQLITIHGISSHSYSCISEARALLISCYPRPDWDFRSNATGKKEILYP